MKKKLLTIGAVFLVLIVIGSLGNAIKDDSGETTVATNTYGENYIADEVPIDDEADLSITPQVSDNEAQPAFTTIKDAIAPTVLPVSPTPTTQKPAASVNIPAYSGKAYVALNNNTPLFTQSEMTKTSFERYSSLDSKGRCGVAYACVGRDIMPTEERGAIGSVKPTGWHTVKYDCVDGKYLYNRCHLIGFQLTGENANERNLITGTRYLNVEGMLPFENMVADYVKETGNHVMYRVTPVFSGGNLLASGVKIEGYSVEDSGEGVCFFVYCYNVQPGVTITYSNGDSRLTNDSVATTAKAASTTKKTTTQKQITAVESHEATYILNTNTKKFHLPGCSSVSKMSEKNKQEFHGTRDAIIAQGYSPCGNCCP